MTDHRSGLPPLPARIAALPVDARGYPVPYFVAWIDGVPDFRVADGRAQGRCVREHRCWICGQPLGRWLAFVVGPMCAINRVSSEPPSHRECAEFSAMACPFLTKPQAERRDSRIPEGTTEPAGVMLKRNPGVSLVWITRKYSPIQVGNGVLFDMGAPEAVLFYCEGRPATRAEVLASVNGGLPALTEVALTDGPKALKELDRQVAAASALWPAEAR